MKILPLICFLFCAVSPLHAGQQRVSVEIGESLKLEELGGPNLHLVINSVDSHDITFALADFDHMLVSVVAGYGGSSPSSSTKQIPVGNLPTLLFKRRDVAVFYLGSGSDMNSVSLAVVTK